MFQVMCCQGHYFSIQVTEACGKFGAVSFIYIFSKGINVSSSGSRISRWGVLTSDVGTFWQKVCENERIGSCWRGRVPMAPPPGSANGQV